MKRWLLTCSVDADLVDYDEIIESDEEPGFWTCNDIAEAHGCPWWDICELDDDDVA